MYRKQDKPTEEFSDHRRTTQAGLARKIPGANTYTRSHASTDPAGETPSCAGVAEPTFENEPAMTDGFASDEAGATVADPANFTEEPRTQVAIIEEVRII
ncbi:EthD family reductase [Rubrobacter indicoceani]|uniref:EthD family reductase n=1 Tax=Rubrobacter indicoceani TaxID=2051957 RepID=UPI000E5B793B|nr:EthD family reductase [Rubrobacter indicoceani]